MPSNVYTTQVGILPLVYMGGHGVFCRTVVGVTGNLTTKIATGRLTSGDARMVTPTGIGPVFQP
jgi:hypothetical protein